MGGDIMETQITILAIAQIITCICIIMLDRKKENKKKKKKKVR